MRDRWKEAALIAFLMVLSPAALAFLVLVALDLLADDDPLGLIALLPE